MNSPAPSPDSMRRGACPSLSAPMPTGDGLLVRLQPESGILTLRQLRGLAELSGEHGNGVLEVTARGNLQIRGLTPASAARLGEGVTALAIEPRRGVPVEASPLAGLDPAETADAAPVAAAIRQAVSAAGLGSRLGPKVTVVVEGGGRIGLEELLADVRVAAIRRPADIAWQVSLAGTAANAQPAGIHATDDVPRAVADLLIAIAEMGIGARGRDLLAGPASTGSREAGRAADGNALVVGPIALKDGTQALAVGLAFGQIGAEELVRFARLAKAADAEAIRLAPQRRLLVLGLSRPSLAKLERAASEFGMITRPDDPRLRIVACAGAPACGSAFFDTKALAARLAPVIGRGGLHVSGCPKRCAEPTGRLAAIVGVSGHEADFVTRGVARQIGLKEAVHAVSALQRDIHNTGGPGQTPSRRPCFVETTPP